MAHYSEVPWESARWPNFFPVELACSCCGELLFLPDHFDCIQSVRTDLGQPLILNSAHRCAIHNARVGGAPLSEHKKIAFDINLSGHDKAALLSACRRAGFTGFGFYSTFLHVDCGRPRRWWSKGGLKVWNGLIS